MRLYVTRKCWHALLHVLFDGKGLVCQRLLNLHGLLTLDCGTFRSLLGLVVIHEVQEQVPQPRLVRMQLGEMFAAYCTTGNTAKLNTPLCSTAAEVMLPLGTTP